MIKALIILSIVLSGCNPLLGVGSLFHSVATSNTTGQLVGVTDIIVKKKTGKTIIQRFIDEAVKIKKSITNISKKKPVKTIENNFY